MGKGIQRVYETLVRGFRRRRMRAFAETFQPHGGTTILDVGGTPFNWELLGSESRLTLLNLELPQGFESLPANYSFVVGDATELEFEDGVFDVAFSNSVIEHLGTWERQQAFAREVRRVGRGLWVQTPARSFPVEPHLLALFVHWLPLRWQRRLVRNFTGWGLLTRPTRDRVDRFLAETRLLRPGEMQALFPDCEIRRERFLGLTKAYVAVRSPADVR
ncbi:MAG: methyltransferase domain-containing protein [Myxococcota bacterium]|nr:methyltransferase domain-containing protein [Myxococcota bacterium]